MENIKVYGINVDKFYTDDEKRLFYNLSKEEFIEEAEKQGLIWSLQGFEKDFNEVGINSDKIIIKILQTEIEEKEVIYKEIENVNDFFKNQVIKNIAHANIYAEITLENNTVAFVSCNSGLETPCIDEENHFCYIENAIDSKIIGVRIDVYELVFSLSNGKTLYFCYETGGEGLEILQKIEN